MNETQSEIIERLEKENQELKSTIEAFYEMVRLSDLKDVEFKIYDQNCVVVDYTEEDYWNGSYGRDLCTINSEPLAKFIKSKLESSKKDSL